MSGGVADGPAAPAAAGIVSALGGGMPGRRGSPASSHPPPRVANIANGLTLLRLVLVPVFGVLLLAGTSTDTRLAAAIVFVVASITDQVDGYLARSRGLVTDVGIIADPIADKALTGMALIGLSVLGELAWWVSIVILAREVLVTGLRLAVLRQAVIPAGRGGKAKTATQVVAITLYLLPLPPEVQPAAVAIMGLALVLTVLTGVGYLVRVLRLRRPSHSDQGQAW